MEEREVKQRIQQGREFLHPWPAEDDDDDYRTDQELKKPQPPLVKEPMTKEWISLPMDFSSLDIDNDFLHVINSRSSHRVFTDEAMNLTQLSFLLWCTQGVKDIRGKKYATLRTVPCGGARHEFECYLAVRKVEGLEDGLYHYLPLQHAVEFLGKKENISAFFGQSLDEQTWADRGNVVFYYSVVPYRAEWRYGIDAHRIVMCDAGHITENLYLSATAIHLGGCAIGAVNGPLCDAAFGLDGEEEFIFYAMVVGTVSEENAQKEKEFYAFVKEQEL